MFYLSLYFVYINVGNSFMVFFAEVVIFFVNVLMISCLNWLRVFGVALQLEVLSIHLVTDQMVNWDLAPTQWTHLNPLLLLTSKI